MDAEFFVWYEENHDILTKKFDELYEADQFEVLENYRAWEDFLHVEYAQYLFKSQHKAAELRESTARQLQDVDWEGQYGTVGF
jgi:hypothetical protein